MVVAEYLALRSKQRVRLLWAVLSLHAVVGAILAAASPHHGATAVVMLFAGAAFAATAWRPSLALDFRRFLRSRYDAILLARMRAAPMKGLIRDLRGPDADSIHGGLAYAAVCLALMATCCFVPAMLESVAYLTSVATGERAHPATGFSVLWVVILAGVAASIRKWSSYMEQAARSNLASQINSAIVLLHIDRAAAENWDADAERWLAWYLSASRDPSAPAPEFDEWSRGWVAGRSPQLVPPKKYVPAK